MDDFSWSEKVLRRFAKSQVDDAEWSALKLRLPVGSQVSGEVLARAPFGVWLDIGVGVPALLEVPSMAGAGNRRMGMENYPAEGAVIAARVIGFRENTRRQVYLSQRD